jgi:hypothetical protein
MYLKEEVQCRNYSLSEQKVHRITYSQVSTEGGNLEAFIKLCNTGISLT